MSKILFLDSECNSLDTERGFIQELAWAVYDIDQKRLLKSQSHLLQWIMHYEVDPQAFAVTGLSREFCEKNGKPAPQVFSEFLKDVSEVDVLGGHNLLDYDKPMIWHNILRTLFSPPKGFMEKFTFDTMFDCPYPNPRQVMALKYLSYDHGFILSNAHQAMADVFACAHVFFSYPYEKCLEIAKTQLMTMHGYTQWGDEEGRESFYRQKFRWNRERKRWERRARAFYIPGTQLELGRDLFTMSGGNECRIKVEQKEAPANVEEIPF